MDYGLVALVILAAYLLGSLNFSIVISGLFHRVDIRNYGSGNAGSTNAYRVMGKKWAAVVMIGDILKSLLAVSIGAWLLGPPGFEPTGKILGGLFVIIGHIFPLYFGFRGGKGVITAAATIAMIDWRVFLIVFAVFCIMFVITRWVSLGSIIGVAGVPVGMYFFHSGEGRTTLVLVALSCAFSLLVIFMHRENIKRIFKGEEKRFSFAGRAVLDTIKEKSSSIKDKTASYTSQKLHRTSMRIRSSWQKTRGHSKKIKRSTAERFMRKKRRANGQPHTKRAH